MVSAGAGVGQGVGLMVKKQRKIYDLPTIVGRPRK